MDISEKQRARRREIFEATYKVLAEKGYKGCSMLEVAKAAKASNETLYNWFGSKQGLLAAMVEDNARAASDVLERASAGHTDIHTCLEELGPSLLELVTSERAIALNRAAAADVADGGVLGRTIAEHGRDLIAGKLRKLLQSAASRGEISRDQARDMAETFLGMLIGDIQIRRVIGVEDPLDRSEIDRRVLRALEAVDRLRDRNEKAT